MAEPVQNSPGTDNKTPIPPKPRKHFVVRHSHVIVLEVLASFILLVALAAGAFVWRMMQGPMDMGFARNYVVEALRIPEQGLTPTVGDIVLSWPDLNGPLLLGFKNARIFNAQGKQVLAVDEAALSLSKARLLIGQISPVALIVREPTIKIARTPSGKIVFGMAGLNAERDTYGPFLTREEEDQGLEKILRYIARPGRQHKGLGTLEALKIEGAKLLIEDKTMATSWSLPRMDAYFESDEKGISSQVDIQFPEGASAGGYFKMDIRTPWETKRSEVRAVFKDFDPWFFAQKIPALSQFQQGNALFDGEFTGVMDESYKPLAVSASLASAGGKFLSTTWSKNPVSFEAMNLNASYDAAQGRLKILDSKLTVQDISLEISADLEASPMKISGPVRVSIDQIEQKRFGELWPPFLEGENAKEWLVHKLSEGTFKNVYADIDVLGMQSDEGWFFNVPNVIAGFDIEGMKVDYRPPLFPVTKGKGKGVFNLKNETLDIEIESGKIGALDISKGALAFTRIIEKGMGQADIKVSVKGPLAEGLRYVGQEPVSVKTKFDPDKVKGDAALDVHVQLPTHKDVKIAEVKVEAKGTLDNVFLPGVVKDMSLIGGPLNLQATQSEIAVDGKGEIGGRHARFEYKEFTTAENAPYKYTVKANVSTDGAFRRGIGVNVEDYLEGTAPADITYTEFSDGRADVSVSGDLTPANVFLKPFGYEKKAGQAGKVSLKAFLKDDVPLKIEEMQVSAPDLALSNMTLGFRQKNGETEISKGGIGSFSIGQSKGNMNFTVSDAVNYKINVASSQFDIAPFVNKKPNKEPYDNPPMVIDLAAEKMLGADGKKMGSGKFLIDIDRQGFYNRLDVSTSAGKGAIDLSLSKNENNIRTFRMDAADAGAMLSAFGIYNNVRGGEMKVRGRAKNPGDRNMTGKGSVVNFRVVNAPTLAGLVNALSLPGLLSTLNGQGLVFSKLEADYTWNSKAGGSVLEFEDGRTSGNSIGFTFEGKVNLADSTLNISGTMIPLSDINNIIKSIPLVGDILTGGTGLIAATYTVKGPTEKPSTMVNPLSVLTPGILRRILFE